MASASGVDWRGFELRARVSSSHFRLSRRTSREREREREGEDGGRPVASPTPCFVQRAVVPSIASDEVFRGSLKCSVPSGALNSFVRVIKGIYGTL